jgi:hypothetical protein
MGNFAGVRHVHEQKRNYSRFYPDGLSAPGALSCATLLSQPGNSQQGSPREDSSSRFVRAFTLLHSDASDDEGDSKNNLAIPPGTILPVRLNSTISSAKCRTGQVITGRIMQDLALFTGARIRAGSKVAGHIVEVVPGSTGAQARISLQLDKLVSSHQTIAITTNLRAIAGFMRIVEAQTPPIGPSAARSL